VSRNYWEVHGSFAAQAASTWPLVSTRNCPSDSDTDLKPERLWEVNRAETFGEMPGQARHRHRGKQTTTQLSPALYDLTSLQREANGRLDFRQDHALAGQALYEKHKS